jgi:hypothetical protein
MVLASKPSACSSAAARSPRELPGWYMLPFELIERDMYGVGYVAGGVFVRGANVDDRSLCLRASKCVYFGEFGHGASSSAKVVHVE